MMGWSREFDAHVAQEFFYWWVSRMKSLRMRQVLHAEGQGQVHGTVVLRDSPGRALDPRHQPRRHRAAPARHRQGVLRDG